MIDIHSHILPGVDDGSDSLKTSLKMLETARVGGTTDIIATPHVVEVNGALKWQVIKEKVAMLQREADSAGIEIKIHPGAEVQLSFDILKYILSEPDMYGLAESRYILIELPMHQYPVNLPEMIYELQLAGRIPVLAHPERQNELMDNPETLLSLLKNGVYSQINSTSLTGKFGKDIELKSKFLLDHDMVTFVGSDTHNTTTRIADLSHAFNILSSKYGLEKSKRLTLLNQQHIIKNEDVPADLFVNKLPDTLLKKKKRGFLHYIGFK